MLTYSVSVEDFLSLFASALFVSVEVARGVEVGGGVALVVGIVFVSLEVRRGV